tara:strand:- start:49 stop:444 length:396 start_codon:yes stop_codon:yes gene_type:complete
MKKYLKKIIGGNPSPPPSPSPSPSSREDDFPKKETLDRIRDFSYHFAEINFGDIFSEKLCHQVGDILFQYWALSQSIHWIDLSIVSSEMSLIDEEAKKIAVLFERLSNHVSNPEKEIFEGYTYERKPYQGH